MMPVLLCVFPPFLGGPARKGEEQHAGGLEGAASGKGSVTLGLRRDKQATGWGPQGGKVLGNCEAFGDSQADESMDLAREMQ